MSLAGTWKQLWWSSDCRQSLENRFRQMDQQWQKPGGGRTRVESVTWYVQ